MVNFQSSQKADVEYFARALAPCLVENLMGVLSPASQKSGLPAFLSLAVLEVSEGFWGYPLSPSSYHCRKSCPLPLPRLLLPSFQTHKKSGLIMIDLPHHLFSLSPSPYLETLSPPYRHDLVSPHLKGEANLPSASLPLKFPSFLYTSFTPKLAASQSVCPASIC